LESRRDNHLCSEIVDNRHTDSRIDQAILMTRDIDTDHFFKTEVPIV
jgi:hypothetical protein